MALGASGCRTFFDAFVTKMNDTGTQLVYSTYYRGGGIEVGFDV